MPEAFTLAAECHVDTTLARALVRGNEKLVEHIFGAPKVGQRLTKLAQADTNSWVVGLVDYDRGSIFDVPGLQLYAQYALPDSTFVEHGFQIYRRPDRPTHFLVVLQPACDGWLFAQAAAAGITLADHRLPADWPAFLAFTKSKLVEDHPHLVSLLKALRRRPPVAFQVLLTFIEEQVRATGREIW
jgi:hypothetical protein